MIKNSYMVYVKKMIITLMLGVVCGFCGSFFVVSFFICALLGSVIYGLNYRQKAALSCVFVIVSTLIYVFTKTTSYGIIMHILNILNVLLPAWVLCITAEKGTTNLRTAVHCLTIANTAITIGGLWVYKTINKVKIADDYIIPLMNNLKKEYITVMQSQTATAEYSAQFEKYFDVVREYFVMFLPVMIVAVCMFSAFIITEIFMFIVNKTNFSNKSSKVCFSEFKLLEPLPCSGTVLLIIFAVVLFGKSGILSSACSNLIAFIMLEYSLCGLAVVFYWLSKCLRLNGISKIFVYIVAVLFLSIISVAFGGILNILLLIGMFDSTFNFRKLKRSERFNR